MTLLKVDNISAKYDATEVLKEVNLSIEPGEILAIVGESGSGKTTLLKTIQGLHPLTEGVIYFQDEKVPHPDDVLVPGVEGIETVYQDFNLQPGLTVFNNIKHHLNHLRLEDQYKLTEDLIELCSMNEFSDYFPKMISGGQKQKTALAMALISEPEMILLDEPFSHLDPKSKEDFLKVILQLRDRLNVSFVFVTHNYQEAMEVADRIVVLKKGEIILNESKEEVIDKNNSAYVAKLLGAKNIVRTSDFEALKDSKAPYAIINPEAIQIVSDKDGEWLIQHIPDYNFNLQKLQHKTKSIALFIDNAGKSTKGNCSIEINSALVKYLQE
jgi:ABC-type Fe3+/spermidine/putrescine transport system ATPase subunit